MKLAVKGRANRIAFIGISDRATDVKVIPFRHIVFSYCVLYSVLEPALSSSSELSVTF